MAYDIWEIHVKMMILVISVIHPKTKRIRVFMFLSKQCFCNLIFCLQKASVTFYFFISFFFVCIKVV